LKEVYIKLTAFNAKIIEIQAPRITGKKKKKKNLFQSCHPVWLRYQCTLLKTKGCDNIPESRAEQNEEGW